MTTLLLVGGIGFLVSAIIVIVSVASAPVGYQDETGFHMGLPDEQSAPTYRARTSSKKAISEAAVLTGKHWFGSSAKA